MRGFSAPCDLWPQWAGRGRFVAVHVFGGGAVLGAVAGVGRDVVAVLLICVVVARARGGMTVLRPILFV